jgi:Flp pilus assembly protein TadB
MSRLRWTLVALLIASTALFAVGVIAERSDADEHAKAENAEVRADGEETPHAENEAASDAEGLHEEGEAPGSKATHADEEDEALLGIDLESTPLVVIAVIAGLGLAALAATGIGRLPGFLLIVAVIALAWAALDVREVLHQLDESRTGIAVVAMIVAALHLAVASISGRLARQRPPAAR